MGERQYKELICGITEADIWRKSTRSLLREEITKFDKEKRIKKIVLSQWRSGQIYKKKHDSHRVLRSYAHGCTEVQTLNKGR